MFTARSSNEFWPKTPKKPVYKHSLHGTIRDDNPTGIKDDSSARLLAYVTGLVKKSRGEAEGSAEADDRTFVAQPRLGARVQRHHKSRCAFCTHATHSWSIVASK